MPEHALRGGRWGLPAGVGAWSDPVRAQADEPRRLRGDHGRVERHGRGGPSGGGALAHPFRSLPRRLGWWHVRARPSRSMLARGGALRGAAPPRAGADRGLRGRHERGATPALQPVRRARRPAARSQHGALLRVLHAVGGRLRRPAAAPGAAVGGRAADAGSAGGAACVRRVARLAVRDGVRPDADRGAGVGVRDRGGLLIAGGVGAAPRPPRPARREPSQSRAQQRSDCDEREGPGEPHRHGDQAELVCKAHLEAVGQGADTVVVLHLLGGGSDGESDVLRDRRFLRAQEVEGAGGAHPTTPTPWPRPAATSATPTSSVSRPKALGRCRPRPRAQLVGRPTPPLRAVGVGRGCRAPRRGRRAGAEAPR